MDRKSKPKHDDPERSERFIATATEHGADDEKALERALKKIAAQPKRESKRRP